MPRGSRFRAAAARSVPQLARFACVGVSNTVLSYVAYVALVSAGLPYLVAGAVGFAAGAVNGYRLNRRWTFRASDSTTRRMRYLIVQVASLFAATNLLWLVVSFGGVHRLIGYLLTIPVVTVASFAANRVWTFSRDDRRASAPGSVVFGGANGPPVGLELDHVVLYGPARRGASRPRACGRSSEDANALSAA